MFLVSSKRKTISTTSKLSPNSSSSSSSSSLVARVPQVSADTFVRNETDIVNIHLSSDKRRRRRIGTKHSITSPTISTSEARQSDENFTILIIKSTAIIAARIFRESFGVLRRWLHLSLQTLFISISSLASYFSLSAWGSTEGEHLNVSESLTKQLAVCYLNTEVELECLNASNLFSHLGTNNHKNNNNNNQHHFYLRAASGKFRRLDEGSIGMNQLCHQRATTAAATAQKRPTTAPSLGVCASSGLRNWNNSSATPNGSFEQSGKQSQLQLNSISHARQTSLLKFQGQQASSQEEALAPEESTGAFERATTSARTRDISLLATRRQHFDSHKALHRSHCLKGTTTSDNQPDTSRGCSQPYKTCNRIVADVIGQCRVHLEEEKQQHQHYQRQMPSAAGQHVMYFRELVKDSGHNNGDGHIKSIICSGANNLKINGLDCNGSENEVDNTSGRKNASIIENGVSDTRNTCDDSMILISRESLGDLTKQIGINMNKMRDLEQQVRVIPEIERRLNRVISNLPMVENSNSIKQLDFTVGSNSVCPRDVVKTAETQLELSLLSSRPSSSSPTWGLFNKDHSSNESDLTPDFMTNAATSATTAALGACSSSGFGTDSSRMDSCNSIGVSFHNHIYSNQQQQKNSFILNNTPDYHHQQTNTIRTDTNDTNLKNFRSSSSSSSSSRHVAVSKHHERGNIYQKLLRNNTNCVKGATITNQLPLEGSNCLGSEQEPIFDRRLPGSCSTRNLNMRAPIRSTPLSQHHLNHNHFHSQHNSQPIEQLSSTTPNESPNRNLNSPRQSFLNNSSKLSNNTMSSNLLITSMPIKPQLDCGCLSFKEHLKYNSMSREQRINQSKQLSSTMNHSSHISPKQITTQNTQVCSNRKVTRKFDASTQTDLLIEDLVSKQEYNAMILNIHRMYCNFQAAQVPMTNMSSLAINTGDSHIDYEIDENYSVNVDKNLENSLSSGSSSTGLKTYSKSSADSSEDDDDDDDDEANEARENSSQDPDISDVSTSSRGTSNRCVIDEAEEQIVHYVDSSDSGEKYDEQKNIKSLNNREEKNLVENEDDEDDEDKETHRGSSNSQDGELYSLGSSDQDSSNFEEYCAYGDSLDRRTRDFMSKSTKIPPDLRFALIRLDDYIKDKSLRDDNNQNNCNTNITSSNIMETSSSSSSSAGCIRVITEEWFAVTTRKDSQVDKARLYIEYFESFTKQLLNFVINLVDSAGNTAIHYAASHFNMDIIKLLIDTKVCDVNCKNKAGYTPIMLLALANIEQPESQNIARLLFSMGDVNMKARSSGQTALMLAATNGRAITCRLLLECGADPSLQDDDGSTALMCGSELGHKEVVECLLESKLTDPTATDNEGLDALTIAMNNGHRDVGLILYAAKNVPKMNLRLSAINLDYYQNNNHPSNNINHPIANNIQNHSSKTLQPLNATNLIRYLGGSLRRTRGKIMASSDVRRTDSLSKSRIARLIN